ncbi:MAG: hypothetical protein WEC00_00880 [Dongiaceae bacterium]
MSRKGGIGWVNALAQAAITASSEVANLPASNLVSSPHRADRWRSDDASDAWLAFDLGVETELGVIGLFGSNLTAAGEWRVRVGSTPGGDDIHDTGLVNAGVSIGYGQALLLPDPAPVGRYLTIDLSDAGVSLQGYHEAGFAWAGPFWSPERNFSFGWPTGWRDPSEKTRSRGGQVWPDRLPKYRMVELRFEWLNETESRDGFMELQRLAGTTENVVVVPRPDRAARNKESVLGHIVTLGDSTHVSANVFASRLGVEERL